MKGVRGLKPAPNKSFDASGGSASRNLRGAAEGALIRAAASTQSFGAYARSSVAYTTKEKPNPKGESYKWLKLT
jgi:hypothetical protein